MSTYCRVCGKPMEEGQGDICEVCQQNIRAEAMGRHKRIAKDAPRGAGKPGKLKGKKNLPQPQEQEEEKKPHHFKSMAEYLAYLKGKE